MLTAVERTCPECGAMPGQTCITRDGRSRRDHTSRELGRERAHHAKSQLVRNPVVNFLDPRLPDRFWDSTDPCPMSGCWLFCSLGEGGYGRIRVGRGKRYAHRLAYEVLIGDFADGLELDHKCRVRCCVNPAHLEPVTHRENVLRGAAPAAAQAQQTHCKRGHALTADNIYRSVARRRKCKQCDRERTQEAA